MSETSIRQGWPVQPTALWRWILIGGYVLIVGLNLPGHLSTDSIIGLFEGRTGVRTSWGPPMFSAILGVFDKVIPGTGFYLACTILLLIASWASLPSLRPRMSWIAPVVLLAAFALPQVVVYQGIVWKDVLFANLAVAGFVALGRAAVRWQTREAAWCVAFAWLCLAFACLVRQNGAVAVLFAALALGWIGARTWKKGALWALAGFVAPLLIAFLLDAVTPVREPPGTKSQDRGVRLVQNYDLVAAVAQNPKISLPILQADDPQALGVVRQLAGRVYSPTRIDTLSRSEELASAIWRFEDDKVSRQWLELIQRDPLGYAGRRLSIFDWVFRTPQIDQCLPVHIGVAGPPDLEAKLHLVEGIEPQDAELYNYVTWWLDTPFYSHLAYALLAGAVAIFLLIRRTGADIAIAGLMFAGLSFAASFFVISIACDYRYLYMLDLTAITGLLYVAVDPRGRTPIESAPRFPRLRRRR
ncbi:hypothetical protein [Phenylobacterium deserti]|uniref:hypothetical protein n=1 Tax=Phenylobacterium deserti TaxID=1914756 RepID=UPI001058217C|nr:hypothetical protein [Phenylobacterium deserti]